MDDLIPLVRELERIKQRARALGMFTDDRELLECPKCGLMEDVTAVGLLITYPKASGIEAQIATLTAYRKPLIHECVTGQRRITEADVVRSQLSAKTGQLNREPYEKNGRLKTDDGDIRQCYADLGKALKGGEQFGSPLAFKFATEGGD